MLLAHKVSVFGPNLRLRHARARGSQKRGNVLRICKEIHLLGTPICHCGISSVMSDKDFVPHTTLGGPDHLRKLEIRQ